MGSPRLFTAGFLFCGLGAGARGFLQAQARLGNETARFINLGGIDNDAAACADFRRLTGTRAVEADLAYLQPGALRAAWGPRVPDCVFLSPPCKGFSGLLSTKAAAAPKYQALNLLVLQGINLVCSTWDRPPALIVLENVPRIQTRGAPLLAQVKHLLGQLGYVFNEATHDCGEIGGLGQRRRRYLLVARLPSAIPDYVYQPPKLRVRGCGEVLEQLPLPQDPAAGPLHRLPQLSWINWLRLALIPAGGDWRDLPKSVGIHAGNPDAHHNKYVITSWDDPSRTVIGATRPGSGGPCVADPRLESPLAEGEERRAHFSRYDVRSFEEPSRPVTGAGSNGAFAVADPRVEERRAGALGVTPWGDPSACVVGESYPSNGSASVADPRIPLGRTGESAGGFGGRPGLMAVNEWGEPFPTVTANPTISGGNSTAAVADPRVELDHEPRRGSYAVMPWEDPAATVRGISKAQNGGAAVADPRLPEDGRFHGSLGVMAWQEPAPTVRGASNYKTGRSSVADPRVTCAPRVGAYGVVDWRRPAGTVTGNARIDNGRFAIADPRAKGDRRYPLIISEDGTWHRPLTTLELAALQGLPSMLDGQPLQLAGRQIAGWRERIGNAVPVGAAKAIAETVLKSLLAAATGAWFVSDEAIWVRRRDLRKETEWAQEVRAP